MLQALKADNLKETARRAKEQADQSPTATSSVRAYEGTCQTSHTQTPSTSGLLKKMPSLGPQAESQESTQSSPYRTAPTHTESQAMEPSPPKLTKDEQLALKEEQIQRAIGTCDFLRNH